MKIFTKICKSIDYKDFILQNVHPADSGNLGYQKLSIVAAIHQFCYDAGGNEAIVLIFEKFAVWATLAGSFNAVAIVDEDFH